jgi:hypothetical protein
MALVPPLFATRPYVHHDKPSAFLRDFVVSEHTVHLGGNVTVVKHYRVEVSQSWNIEGVKVSQE